VGKIARERGVKISLRCLDQGSTVISLREGREERWYRSPPEGKEGQSFDDNLY